MTKYVTTDINGLPTGFYDSRIAAPPVGAQVVTDAQYLPLISAPNTTTFVAGALGAYAYSPPTPSPAIQAQIALGAGLAVTSTAHSVALNGTYALDTTTMELASDLAALINANSGAFPGSVSTWSWPDLAGALHVFPSAAEFLAFHTALATYRLALYSVIWGVTSTLPTDAATIP
jgi:hypothetical protein